MPTTAVVTGAGRGIGRAVADRLARDGALVLALDLDVSRLETADPPGAGPGTILPHRCDCTDADQIARALDSVDGPVHVLVNCAGVNADPAPVDATTTESWNGVLDANLGSVFLVSRAVLPRMTDGGSMVHVASILGLAGVRSCAAYTASKAAIVGLTRAMARDHAPSIRVNCVCPGAIDTDMFEEYVRRTADPAAERQRIESEIPLGRLGQPEDVAGAVAFLASDEAAWITGSVLVVDGGDSA